MAGRRQKIANASHLFALAAFANLVANAVLGIIYFFNQSLASDSSIPVLRSAGFASTSLWLWGWTNIFFWLVWIIALFLIDQPFRAVTLLSWKAAFRFRLFWVLVALLLGSVVLLPLLIRDDGTARGFIQIMLTYTLSVITALLGFSTLWLACGSLARDIEDCSMQMVV